ncbi:MAG: succinate dehydrogenase, cytochrome b556 subunit [Alphaproteobacteria bacterium]|nr:succinate dehydrogenase, cytochrome b556 subunit [Alphaproteobacteria bacterium]
MAHDRQAKQTAHIMDASQRPLSPHIQIYRWTLTMALSILHRATGLALYAGTLLFVAWLVAVALGETHYVRAQMLAHSWYGVVILLLYVWALFHHMCGGIRHFIWDMGYGFKLRHVEWLAWFSVFMPFVLTACVCYLAMMRGS